MARGSLVQPSQLEDRHGQPAGDLLGRLLVSVGGEHRLSSQLTCCRRVLSRHRRGQVAAAAAAAAAAKTTTTYYYENTSLSAVKLVLLLMLLIAAAASCCCWRHRSGCCLPAGPSGPAPLDAERLLLTAKGASNIESSAAKARFRLFQMPETITSRFSGGCTCASSIARRTDVARPEKSPEQAQ